MRHHAALFFPYPAPIADAIARALEPESAQTEVPKTRGRIERTPEGLRIHIDAADLPSLRASVNSHLRWVDAAARAAHIGTT